MSDPIQIIATIIVILCMILAYLQLFHTKVYIRETKIIRAAWFMCVAGIVGGIVF